MNLKYLAFTLFVVLSLPGNTAAQLAPTGGHYAGRGSDTGHGGAAVSPNGTFAASVPLELPPSRRGLPVPVSLVYGAKGFGVAGVGWDVPQSYVRLDTSFAHRRPRGDVDPPEGRE